MTVPGPLTPPGSAVTTPEQMLAEIRAVHFEVTTLNAAITQALPDIRSDVAAGSLRVDGIDSRLGALERWRATATGALLIVPPIVSGVISYIVLHA